jgi:hypothetical protein
MTTGQRRPRLDLAEHRHYWVESCSEALPGNDGVFYPAPKMAGVELCVLERGMACMAGTRPCQPW